MVLGWADPATLVCRATLCSARQHPSLAGAKGSGHQMDSTVREHICRLKARVDLLSEEIADSHCTPLEVKNSKAELGTAFLALAHYEAALKQERKLAFLAQEASRLRQHPISRT